MGSGITRWLEIGGGAGVLAFGLTASAQQPIGSIAIADATMTGATNIANDRATLAGNGTVVAKDHVAYVQLYRGGTVTVCATSGVHLTAGAPAPAAADAPPVAAATAAPTLPANLFPPLMVALDRGALELRTSSVPGDILMTPDLRVSFSESGQLDLRIRVTRNGDTCVENRVAGLDQHPTLKIGSLFGDETYNVLPGQHVLFERGNLHEVVDNESSPCGCPDQPAVPAPPQLGAISLKPVPKTSSEQAAEQHPFPAAVSQGLAPPPEVPQAPPGIVHTQVATTLSYSGDAAEKPAEPPKTAPAQPDSANPQQKPVQEKSGFFHSLGRFFKKIF